jgi:CRP-like cAMP-binding protein
VNILSTLADIESGVRFLDGLTESELQSVLLRARQVKFKRRSIPINQGQPAEKLFLLIKGRARFFIVTQDGRKIILHWLVPGQIFGVAAVLRKQSRYLVGTEIVQDSVALVWHRSAIRSLAERYCRLVDNMFSISEEYLVWYLATHEALMSGTARDRLAHLLARLAVSVGHKVLAGMELHITNEELASAIGVNQFTVSRLLSDWQRSRLVAKTRNRLVIRSPQLLLRKIVTSP